MWRRSERDDDPIYDGKNNGGGEWWREGGGAAREANDSQVWPGDGEEATAVLRGGRWKVQRRRLASLAW
jgi:hypothetical protein